MPKAGTYSYPVYDIDFTIEKLQQYYDAVRTYDTTRELAAEALGMAVKGGGFLYVVTSMEKYGLIQTGRGRIEITELGKTILFGEPNEVEQAKKKAVSNVDLFRELYEQYGKDVDLEKIRMFLRHRANVDIEKAQKIAPKVHKLYIDVSNYIIPAQRLAQPSIKHTAPSMRRRESIAKPETQESAPYKFEHGGLYIQIPSNSKALESIAFAKEALNLVEKRIRAQSGREEHN